MKREKEIAFSDFFKEDFFNAGQGVAAEEPAVLTPLEDHTPVLVVKAAVDDAELRAYRKALRLFFVTGEQTAHCLKAKTAPVLLAPYLRGEMPDTGFPVFFSFEDHSAAPLRQVFQAVFENAFPQGNAKILAENLPRLELLVRQAMETEKAKDNFESFIEIAVSTLMQLDVHGEEGKAFREHCVAFQAALLKKHGLLLPFSAFTAFQLLNLQLQAFRGQNKAFIETLKIRKAGLEELLILQKEYDPNSDQASGGFDFAGGLIAFDKIEGMMPPSASSHMPEPRRQRISAAIETLDKALKFFAETSPRVFVNSETTSRFALKKILNEASIMVCEQKACTEAKAVYDKELPLLVETIAAARIAELEIHYQYDEDLHTPYFKSFGRRYLAEEDMKRFPPLLVVETSRQLMHEPEGFLELLSGDIPVKVLALTLLSDLDYPDSTTPSLHLEPAALALSHRNAFIFQGAVDTPAWFNHAMREGLLAPSPALWNVLLPEPGNSNSTSDFIRIHAAIESRYFPRLSYNIRAGAAFGSRFDIGVNPQPEMHFPSYALDIQTRSGFETAKYELTVADFFAMDSSMAAQLEVVPVDYRNEDLISLAAYFYLSSDKLIGKAPFIWVVDEQHQLYQAAIPYSWLARCEERLDYWQFIQELGGVNSYHVKRAIEKARTEWDAQKAAEIAALKAKTEAEIETVRKEEAGRAMERLVNVLLDIDNPAFAPAAQPATPAQETSSEATIEKAAPEPAHAEETVVSSEVWVESFRCTSCNDCVDGLPGVFKYNSDKQAYAHNPKGGTYAKIVALAEKCPAKCIHPGLPQNPAEPGVEELVKRAEALN